MALYYTMLHQKQNLKLMFNVFDILVSIKLLDSFDNAIQQCGRKSGADLYPLVVFVHILESLLFLF